MPKQPKCGLREAVAISAWSRASTGSGMVASPIPHCSRSASLTSATLNRPVTTNPASVGISSSSTSSSVTPPTSWLVRRTDTDG